MVYIILVNYNGYLDTVDCVKSILDNDYPNYKIIIVDNASADRDTILNDTFLTENADILLAGSNDGFSSGNNIGIKCAMSKGCEYVLLLNNDTIVEKNFLSELVNCAESNPMTGIVTGRIYCYYDKKTLWYSGGEYNRANGLTNQVLFDESVKGEKEVTFASGCMMLISNNCLKKIGLLGESFFLYSEDTDYCCRVNDSGMKIIWSSDSVIYHKVSASTGNNSDFQNYYMLRNNLYMIQSFGSNKKIAYWKRRIQCIKDIIKRRLNIRTMHWAYADFHKGIKGKGIRFNK
ncbi:MAG: glycosyltransferase family 2 protein [Lachnospiraceae bacterium]|nr:glycosyltransferase family 2 protein [Lachnospiraceae bacterium]